LKLLAVLLETQVQFFILRSFTHKTPPDKQRHKNLSIHRMNIAYISKKLKNLYLSIAGGTATIYKMYRVFYQTCFLNFYSITQLFKILLSKFLIILKDHNLKFLKLNILLKKLPICIKMSVFKILTSLFYCKLLSK